VDLNVKKVLAALKQSYDRIIVENLRKNFFKALKNFDSLAERELR